MFAVCASLPLAAPDFADACDQQAVVRGWTRWPNFHSVVHPILRASFTLMTTPLDGRPPRNYDPLPTSPPYTAFLGNLSYGVTESEVAAFFDGYEVRHNPLAQPKIGHSRSFPADQIYQNSQGQRWPVKGIWLH